jgi:DNA-binding transcriptional LysR family regulator
MDIIKLRCFVALSECLSFSLAAYELNISQSSLSKHIMSLEKELGVEIFERRGRNTLLTEMGKTLSAHARNILLEYDRLVQKSDEFKEYATKTTTIGITPMGCQYFWLRRIEEIMAAYPKRNIEIIERYEIELINLAARDELEYLIIRKEILPAKGFRTHLLYVDKAAVIISESHPLAKKKRIGLQELSDEAFIYMDEASAPHRIFKNACHKAGFEPRIAHTMKSEAITMNYIQANEGICLYFNSDMNFFSEMKGIRIVPLESEIISEIVLAVPTARKLSATEKFLAEELTSLDS